ncbi:MAG: alternative ribosome rescue aminoacyl-tRNA hydrolase ArfB [Bacteroidota bacterium]
MTRFSPPYLNAEFVYKTSRSGGKGGQNVNKIASKVQLDFDVINSLVLTTQDKTIILEKLAGKISAEGLLQVVCQTERTQLANKLIAIKKIYALINKCFIVKKLRKATKPSKGSVEKRLTTKKTKAQTKKLRSKPFFDKGD